MGKMSAAHESAPHEVKNGKILLGAVLLLKAVHMAEWLRSLIQVNFCLQMCQVFF